MAPRRELADGELEHGDADERQRPPPPRGKRQGDGETAGKGDERPPGCRQPAGAVDVVVVGRGGSTRASVVGIDEVEEHDDALGDRPRRVAGEQRGRMAVVLGDHPHRVGRDDLHGVDDVDVLAGVGVRSRHRYRHPVGALEPLGGIEVEDHLVARLQLVEAAEVGVVARAVPGDDDVAELARASPCPANGRVRSPAC